MRTIVEEKIETKKKQKVDIDDLQEVKLAKEKYSHSYSGEKFSEVSSVYDKVEQGETDEINQIIQKENKKDNKIEAYLSTKTNKNKYTSKNSIRIKLFSICAVIVLALTSGLVIYNTVEITLLNMQVTSTEAMTQTGSANLESALKQLKKITDTQTLQSEAEDINMSNVETERQVNLIETRTPEIIETNSNWFDSLCNFLGNLFGSR